MHETVTRSGKSGRSAGRTRNKTTKRTRSEESKQLDQTEVLVKHAEFYELNEAQLGSAVKRERRNCTMPQLARKAEIKKSNFL